MVVVVGITVITIEVSKKYNGNNSQFNKYDYDNNDKNNKRL